MKYIKIIVASTLAITSQLTFSGEVTETYSAGDTLTAAKMNIIKTAINDNNDFKQNQSTSGQCTTGRIVQSISSTGVVVCASDADSGGDITAVTAGNGLQGGGVAGEIAIRRSNGFISIPASAFISQHNGAYSCQVDSYFHSTNFKLLTSTEDLCLSVAAVSLPDGATITEFSCTLFDTDPDPEGTSFATLNAYGYADGSLTVGLFASTDETEYNLKYQLYTSSTTINHTIDNSRYGYDITWLVNNNVGPINASDYGIAGCKIGYEF